MTRRALYAGAGGLAAIFLLASMFAFLAPGQTQLIPPLVGGTNIQFVTTDPTGVCSSPGYITQNLTTGVLTGCVGGTWSIIGGGGTYGVGADGTLALAGNLFSVTSGVFANMPATNGFVYRTGASSTASKQVVKTFHGYYYNGAAVIPTGALSVTGAPLDEACTFSSYSIVATPAGSATIGVWKANAAIPTIANEITNGSPMAITTSTANLNVTPTGWTTFAGATGDVVIFNILTLSTFTSLDVYLYCTI